MSVDPARTVLEPAFAGPLFVVGPSRSGTSLMRVVLNGHPEVGLAGETHYFDDLRVRFKDRSSVPVATAAEQAACEDYFLALSHRPYGHGGVAGEGWLSRDALRTRAAKLGGTPDAYYEAFCRIMAEKGNARIWGDKTPRHVFRIGEILATYPSAKVVCMVRDPRAVVLSYRDWQNHGGFDFESDPEHAELIAADTERARQSYNVLLMSLLWRSQVGAIRAAQRDYGDRVYVQRYEDLVKTPDPAVHAVCAWSSLEYSEHMLDVPVLNSSFNEFARDGGFSSSSLDRWRTKSSIEELAVIQTVCRSLMRVFGYDFVPARKPTAVAKEVIVLPVSSVRALRANQDRTGRLGVYVVRRVRNLARRS